MIEKSEAKDIGSSKDDSVNELSAKSSELQPLEEELELLKAAEEMIFDDQRPIHTSMTKWKQRNSRLLNSSLNGESIRKPLEEKKRNLEHSLLHKIPRLMKSLQN